MWVLPLNMPEERGLARTRTSGNVEVVVCFNGAERCPPILVDSMLLVTMPPQR